MNGSEVKNDYSDSNDVPKILEDILVPKKCSKVIITPPVTLGS